MSALRILYLEDNPDHIALVLESLQCQFPGTHVESASLLPEALVSLETKAYDAVFVTASLHGEPVSPRLKDIVTAAQGAPIIVIAGSGDEKSAANAIRNGAADYLVKSRETLEVLPYLLQRLLKKRRQPTDTKPNPSPSSSGVDHLVAEIDQVSRRIHSLQEGTHTDISIHTLHDEIQQLKQFALQLSETIKYGKTRSA